MANNTTTATTDVNAARGTRRWTTETRPATKTTELMAYVATVLAVALTALFVGDGGADPFSAEQALRYITFLTVGYMVARGLAKSGTRGNNGDHDA